MNFALNEIELPVRIRFERPMTDDELMRFCADNDVLRVERDPNGEILVMTPANSNTSKMNMRIGRILDEWSESDGRGFAFDSSGGFTLPDGSMRNPDAAWILCARWTALTREEQGRFAPLCPDFIIELRSPSDRLPDLRAKMTQWITNGAQVAWLDRPRREIGHHLPPRRGARTPRPSHLRSGHRPHCRLRTGDVENLGITRARRSAQVLHRAELHLRGP